MAFLLHTHTQGVHLCACACASLSLCVCDLVAHDNVNHSTPFVAAWLHFFRCSLPAWVGHSLSPCVCVRVRVLHALVLVQLQPSQLSSATGSAALPSAGYRRLGSSVLIRRHETLRFATWPLAIVPSPSEWIVRFAVRASSPCLQFLLLLLVCCPRLVARVLLCFAAKKNTNRKVRYN